jgi:hypothetical protein
MVEFLKAKPTSFVNKPRGIIDTRTGEGQVYEQIANLGDQMSRMGFEDAVVEQEKIGKDYVASLQTRDEQGKLQFVALPESLSKVARDAATPQLRKRYANELQLDTSNKIAELHRTYKDDPIGFEFQSNLYITETVNTLRANGYQEVAGDYATNAAGLVVQHSNDLKLKAFKKQEESANEKQRVLIDNQIQDSYENRVGGKSKEADEMDKAVLASLDDLIARDVVNAPYYKEQRALVLRNKKQAIMELQFQNFSAGQMAAYNRSLTLGKISDRDKALLPNLTDQHFIDQRKDMRPEDIRVLTAWGSTTKGRFADDLTGKKKTYEIDNTAKQWNSKTLSIKSTKVSNDLDAVVGNELGLGRKATPNDILNATQPQTQKIMEGQKGNASVPTSIKQVIGNPSIAITNINNKLEQGNRDGAESSINNLINVAKVSSGLIGVDRKGIARIKTVEILSRRDGDVVKAFQETFKTPERRDVADAMVKNKIIESDDSITDENYSASNFFKKKIKGLDLDLDGSEIQELVPVMRTALEAEGATIEDALEVAEKYYEAVYKSHPSNYNINERKTGTPDRGGIASYYGDNTDKVVEIINNKLKADLPDDTETSFFGLYTTKVDYELGENAFLLPDRSNGNKNSGRWTVVDADGKPLTNEFGVIEITTQDIELSSNIILNEAKEAIADETIGKYFNWWNNFSFDTDIRIEMGEIKGSKSVNLDAPAPSIDTFDDTAKKKFMSTDLYVQPTGSEMQENIDIQPDAMRNINDAVDEAIDTVDRTVVQPVIEGVETAIDKAGKLKDIAVNNIVSFYNKMKAEGAEILRDTPEFIEIAQLANGQVIDELVNSITANKPINAHVGAIEQLIKDEDFSPVQYQDGAGKSVGYGFAVAALEDDERALIKDINNITEKEAKAIINIKVQKIARKFVRDVPNFNSIATTRQIALINFAYQLGYENVTNQGKDPKKQWPKFFVSLKAAAIAPAGSKERDELFAEARNNMVYNYTSKGRFYTDWFNQTPNRAKRVSQSIRGY